MLERVYTLPLGQNALGITLPANQQIRGITIDNPSGSWLRVTGIEDFVPPFTMGWGANVNPARLTVDVLFADSPSGTASQLIGNMPVVTLYDYAVPASGGVASGVSQSQSPTGTDMQTGVFFPPAPEIGVLVSLGLGPTPEQRIVPVRVYGSYNVGGGFIAPPRGSVLIELSTLTPFARYAVMNISPESPTFDFTFTQGVKCDVGSELFITAATETGAGRHDLTMVLQYYMQRG